MFIAVRVIFALFGAAIFAVGLLIITTGGAGAAAGIGPLLIGGVTLIAVVLERQRYRSVSADLTREPTGPGGGEPDPLPPNFRATEERFVDPTSNRVMRVFLDERTGERRYRAEGLSPER